MDLGSPGEVELSTSACPSTIDWGSVYDSTVSTKWHRRIVGSNGKRWFSSVYALYCRPVRLGQDSARYNARGVRRSEESTLERSTGRLARSNSSGFSIFGECRGECSKGKFDADTAT